MCWISGFGEAQQSFLKSDLKNLIQNLWVGTNSPCLLRLQTRKFFCRKITARFKLNLKTDGLDCKMIFKFGKHVERFHSTRKQCRRIYICELVGARPLHLLSQTVLSLKSPTGAFIAALRSANANFALQNTCWEHPNPWTASRGCRLF